MSLALKRRKQKKKILRNAGEKVKSDVFIFFPFIVKLLGKFMISNFPAQCYDWIITCKSTIILLRNGYSCHYLLEVYNSSKPEFHHHSSGLAIVKGIYSLQEDENFYFDLTGHIP